MSTRSVTVVQASGDSPAISLYRAHDGYLAVAGAAILDAVDQASYDRPAQAEDIVAHLLIGEPDGARNYEFTFSPEVHGDLEHIYHVNIAAGEVRVRHSWRGKSDRWESREYTLAAFRAEVESAEHEIRARVEARRGAR